MRSTSSCAVLNAEGEQKILISQRVSKTRRVDVCHFSLALQPERSERMSRNGKSFLANDSVDGIGAFNFQEKMVRRTDNTFAR